MKKRIALQIVFIAIFGLILYVIFKDVSYSALKRAMRETNLLIFALVIPLYIFKQGLVASRFWLSSWLQAKGRVPIGQTLLFEFKLLFFELALPLPNIEDVIRYFYLRYIGISVSSRILSIFYVRVSGLLALSLIFCLSIYELTGTYIQNQHVLIFLVVFTILWLIVLVSNRKAHSWIIELIPKESKLKSWLRLVKLKSIEIDKLMVLALIALGHLAFWALVWKIICVAVGLSISYYQVLIFVPFMVLSFMVPASFQGLGLPEASFYFYLTGLGYNENLALAACILHFLLYLTLIIIGAILSILDTKGFGLYQFLRWRK